MAAQKWGAHTRPEAVVGGEASAHYDEAEAARYTVTNQSTQIQKDLTQRALQLLDLEGQHAVLADVGCGSGLSGQELSEAGHAWVGLDISAPMLQLGSTNPTCQGKLCLGDMAQGLPLRAASLDGVVSISAVQWLCSHPGSHTALARLFACIARCLRPGACAALQVYPEDDAQASLLLTSALRCGFQAGMFIDFPHPNPAKKSYLCLRQPANPATMLPTLEAPAVPAASYSQQEQAAAGGQEAPDADVSARCCNLAWPKIGSCTLRWLSHLESMNCAGATPPVQHSTEPQAGPAPRQHQTRAAAPAAAAVVQQRKAGSDTISARLHQEHATHAKRLLRLLRRAMGASIGPPTPASTPATPPAAAALAPPPASTCAAPAPAGPYPEPGGAPEGVGDLWTTEAEVVAPGLLPCRGSVLVLATLPRHEFSGDGAEGAAAAAAGVAGPAQGDGSAAAARPGGQGGGTPEQGQGLSSAAASAWVEGWLGPGLAVRACRVQRAKLAPVQQAQQGKRAGPDAALQSQSGAVQHDAAQQAKRARGGGAQQAEPQAQGRGSGAPLQGGTCMGEVAQAEQRGTTGEQQQQAAAAAAAVHGAPAVAVPQQQGGPCQGKPCGQQAPAAKPAKQTKQPQSTDKFFSYRVLATLPLVPCASQATTAAAASRSSPTGAEAVLQGGGGGEPVAVEKPEGQQGQGALTLGFLRQIKAPTHLILTFHHAPAPAQPSPAGEAPRGAGASLARVPPRMQRLCSQLNGCVVGCDVGEQQGGGVASSWVVFVVGGVQEGPGEEARLIEAVQECFAAEAGL